jgi:NADH-quinone oxidoreductase subunit L
MKITGALMFVGALVLAGCPFTSGYLSKDTIIADAWDSAAYFSTVMGSTYGPIFAHGLTVVALLTAFLTAFYAFRLWCRVFLGPTQYELGDEHHGHDEDHAHDSHDSKQAKEAFPVEHHHDVHEVSMLMNAPLFILAILALGFGLFAGGTVEKMVLGSSAAPFVPHAAEVPEETAHAVHMAMMYTSGAIFALGAGLAFFFHYLNRAAGDAAAKSLGPIVTFFYRKAMIDELYDVLIVGPLRLASELFFVFDTLVVEGLVSFVGYLPQLFGKTFIKPLQHGSLQGYGVGMAAGVAVIILFVLVVLHLI